MCTVRWAARMGQAPACAAVRDVKLVACACRRGAPVSFRNLIFLSAPLAVIPRNLNAVLRRHTPAAGAEQRILLGLIKRGDIYRPDKSKGYGKKVRSLSNTFQS